MAYTPTPAEFRDWIDSIVKGQRTGSRDSAQVQAEFNRMIEAVKADGFDEGWIARSNRDPVRRFDDGIAPHPRFNPHRK